MYSTEARCQYRNNQLADVICQLRFPDILMINAQQPAAFQEAIRSIYPQFSMTTENAAPKITGTPGNLRLENQQPTVNYQFASADGVWRVNLTSRFIALACNRYTNWEEFAKQLDVPLAAFIQTYKPAYFQRIGLRYINTFSRSKLGLEDQPYSELFQPRYLGLLDDEEVPEHSANRCTVDAEIAIRGGCRAKIHAGPGIVKQNGHTESEVRFIFDMDLFMSGNIPVNYSAGALQTLHSQAYPIFRDAITRRLHDAMEPMDVEEGE